jgi:hypothetical protein
LPVPGELFTRNPTSGQQAAIYADASHDDHARFARNGAREVAHDMVVAMRDIAYNSHGWHDKHGHLYYLEAEGDPATRAGPMEPLFFRAQHGQIVNVVLRNATPETIRRPSSTTPSRRAPRCRGRASAPPTSTWSSSTRSAPTARPPAGTT